MNAYKSKIKQKLKKLKKTRLDISRQTVAFSAVRNNSTKSYEKSKSIHFQSIEIGRVLMFARVRSCFIHIAQRQALWNVYQMCIVGPRPKTTKNFDQRKISIEFPITDLLKLPSSLVNYLNCRFVCAAKLRPRDILLRKYVLNVYDTTNKAFAWRSAVRSKWIIHRIALSTVVYRRWQGISVRFLPHTLRHCEQRRRY